MWKLLGAILVIVLSLWFIFSLPVVPSHSASFWQAESWMQKDSTLPETIPSRVLALTDLPPLEPAPTPDILLAAIQKSKEVGCDGAVLTYSWPSLEPRPGDLTLEELKNGIVINKGRVLFLGIQVLNTTVKDLPTDLQTKRFDDPQVIERFQSFLDALAPLLQNRVRYLSIGNESDIYLTAHPDEINAYATFLNSAYKHAKKIAPDLIVGTTLTDAGALQPEFQQLVKNADAHFLTYYHGQVGVEGTFKDTTKVKEEILKLSTKLDERPIVFQEIGFPAHDQISSAEKQAEFVNGVFDAWDELNSRVPFLNYFMMYDFPESIINDQLTYYGVDDDTKPLVRFLTTLGLHQVDGTPRESWSVFEQRAKELKK
ncbi:glycoside hydrolase 5 family protein [Gimesia aquarii]|uniref:Uncharacterized protein n=1 Tax=Gimesia aquarii TaxID=2527964 RepID=A0A517VS07_9PLAN|nr:hypothetical protein [Gimesia aquarii]QDT95802.1 hypothetical protein V144x_12490 [Gimesia aquarii]